jgi:oxepin-CoA hydrolase/3-oxo-5,6-dehydrosuberyl-CoA semialdehyde dehydrogenase
MNYSNIFEVNFNELRNDLKADTPANFGSLSAQQMIEHLIEIYNYIFVEGQVKVLTPTEKIEKVKKLFLWSSGGFVKGVSNEVTKTFNFETKLPNLAIAIDEYEVLHYKVLNALENKEVKDKTHPIFGLLNNEEWIQFFTKHTWHHYNQFGLVG